MRALKDWDREHGFVEPVSGFPVADLYVCWDKKAVYLGLYAQDIAEEALYRNGIVPEMDRAEWLISIGDRRKSIHVRLGPGAAPVCDAWCAHRQSIRHLHEHARAHFRVVGNCSATPP